MSRRRVVVALAALGLISCGPSEPQRIQLHYFSTSYDWTIVPSQAPPHARERISYTVTILDRKTHQPIENGEGQVYGNNIEGARTWDGFANGATPGSYVGNVSFVTSGTWALAMRFRRDSLHALEKIEWMQEVLQERPVEQRLGVDSIQQVPQSPPSKP